MLVLGDEARENGLKYSLQERLQNLYRRQGGLALYHMVSLNTNYRCHKSIIQIPNKLFYESQIMSYPLKASPHPLAEFPLLFVCSSLTHEVDREVEASLLLEKVMYYIMSNWPIQWGERDWSNIGLVTSSRTQVRIYQKSSHGVKVVTLSYPLIYRS